MSDADFEHPTQNSAVLADTKPLPPLIGVCTLRFENLDDTTIEKSGNRKNEQLWILEKSYYLCMRYPTTAVSEGAGNSSYFRHN